MANFVNMYRQLLSLPLSVLVKNNPIPANPIEELSLNIHQPVVYVLPYTSQTDFVIFRRNCLALGLPDPAEKNEIDGVKLPRYVRDAAFLNRKVRKMKPPRSSINTSNYTALLRV